jgi:AhpD family alkylhydroperoxidase
VKTFAQSPAALQFFLAGSQALAKRAIPAKVREQIDLVVSQANGCDYCLAAHTQLAKGHRLSDEEIAHLRLGR